MATRAQLDESHAYAAHQVENGGADLTIEELLWQWRDREEMRNEIRSALADMEAGLGIPFEQFAEELRQKYESAERT